MQAAFIFARVKTVPIVLALNPGSNSLKFDLVEVDERHRYACESKSLLSGSIEDIGRLGKVQVARRGQTIHSEEKRIADYKEATEFALKLLKDPEVNERERLPRAELAAIRVVHGGDRFREAVRLDNDVRREIEGRKKLAPLHNANSLRIADALAEQSPKTSIAVAFDTAFHHTIPETAWRYPLNREIADRYGIRRYGFHGLSHRYMLERYSFLSGRSPQDISAVTLHLESGSSAAAIKNGRSVDTSMGFTPLEGLMMGTRCGSIDPAIVLFLVEEAGMTIDEVTKLLEKQSGLLGISGVSLDTRILRKRDDAQSKQAIEMFAYRVRQFVGAYLAVLERAEVVIFGGGIGENTPEVRNYVCRGFEGWGLELDAAISEATVEGDKQISTGLSKLGAWVIHSEEGLQLAHECAQVL